MRVVVTGATGNVGTSVLRALSADPAVTEIVGLARRPPQRSLERATFVSADVANHELEPLFRGADVVIHLAWLIQPGRDESVTSRVNITGSQRVFDAVAAAEVPALVYASSVGAYTPGPKDRLVDESWPTEGIPSSFYSRHKAAVERALDRLERDRRTLRVVRLRPGLISNAPPPPRSAGCSSGRCSRGPSSGRTSSRSFPTSTASASRPSTRSISAGRSRGPPPATLEAPSTSPPIRSSVPPSLPGCSTPGSSSCR